MSVTRSARLFATFSLLLAGCSALAPLACGGARARPHVVLISIDTLRADHLGVYGHTRDTSPTLDSLAASSVRFERAIAQAGWTLPSHMSLMTSLLPSTHGVTTNRALAPEAVTLAERLETQGYQTAAFVSWVFLDARYGFGRGFDQFRTLVHKGRVELGSGGGAPAAEEVVDRATEYLESAGEDPVFLFVHLFDPHTDYAAPPDYVARFAPGPARVDGRFETLRTYNRYLDAHAQRLDGADLEHVEGLYDAEIRYVDDQLARLLAAIDRRLDLDDCLLVVTSDHGEEFMDHGSMEGHGWTLYEEVLHVPLLIRFPKGAYGGSVVGAPVGLIDVAPTLLDALAIAIPAAFEGRSLLPLITGAQSAREPPYVYSENDRWNIVRHAVQGPRYKLIFTAPTGVDAAGVPVRAGYELYDLVQDPRETRNLFARDDPRSRAWVALLEHAQRGAAARTDHPTVELSDEEQDLLRSLGYVK